MRGVFLVVFLLNSSWALVELWLSSVELQLSSVGLCNFICLGCKMLPAGLCNFICKNCFCGKLYLVPPTPLTWNLYLASDLVSLVCLPQLTPHICWALLQCWCVWCSSYAAWLAIPELFPSRQLVAGDMHFNMPDDAVLWAYRRSKGNFKG